MKVPAGRADAFARAPDPAVRGVLVYGPDQGLVGERALALVRSVVEDPRDPFRVADITPAALQQTPSLIADEAAAVAMTGGRRVVRLSGATDSHSGILEGFLADPPGDALVVVEAGDLPSRSKLRKAFEAAGTGAALACYRDDARDIAGVVREQLTRDGLTIDRDALSYLATALGGDRGATRREVEKLAVYALGNREGRREVSLADAVACVGDGGHLTVDDIVMAAADGDLPGLDLALQRAAAAGQQPISILMAAGRHFQRLHLAAGLVASGTAPDQALNKLRPPPFWKVRDRVKGQIQVWTVPMLRTAMDRLNEAVAACMTTGTPDQAVAATVLTELARARRARNRR